MFDNHLGGRGYQNFSFLDFYSGLDIENCGFVCSEKEWFEFFFKNELFIKEYIKAVKKIQKDFPRGF